MIHDPKTQRPSVALLVLFAALGSACSDDGPDAPGTATTASASPQLPTSVDVPDPDPRIRHLETVEDLTEDVADWFLDLGTELRRRDFAKVGEWFAEDFAGHALTGLEVRETQALPHSATRRIHDVASAEIVGSATFIEGLESILGGWARCDLALWKVKGAEFQQGAGESWGKIHLYLHLIGDLPSGGREDVNGWAWAEVRKHRGRWGMRRFQLEKLASERMERRSFQEVGAAAGIAHLGIRYGQEGNTDDAWNGAAAGDVDGDGLWDVFVPSYPRNFLYVARGDGQFDEVAEKRGLAQPADGTGPVFLDYDNDGDQDLFVTHRAWIDRDDEWVGETLQMYANNGKGTFRNVTAELGLGLHCYGFSPTVLDYDGDGFLDIFVAAYGRASSDHNDSWIEATNGKLNLLLRNVGGQRFEDVAPKLGLTGGRWSYACAAADFDADGDSDLYVANDYGSNRLWRNDGEGVFVDVAAELGVTDQGNGMGVTWGDLNGDARLDLYVANMSSTAGNRILGRLRESLPESDRKKLKKAAAGNSVFLADPEGGFVRQAKDRGGVGANWAWSAAISDLDLDGCLDVFCVNGFATGDLAHDT